MEDAVKVTFNMNAENKKIIEELAKVLQTNATTVLNRAIVMEKFFQDAIESGGKIMVKEKDGTIREVVFR